ncbi:Fc Receptor-Like Protein 3 [Manis pentadactyla]|nr:Fc Receptor-Like Protein 3 [Manis pentadactyla]
MFMQMEEFLEMQFPSNVSMFLLIANSQKAQCPITYKHLGLSQRYGQNYPLSFGPSSCENQPFTDIVHSCVSFEPLQMKHLYTVEPRYPLTMAGPVLKARSIRGQEHVALRVGVHTGQCQDFCPDIPPWNFLQLDNFLGSLSAASRDLALTRTEQSGEATGPGATSCSAGPPIKPYEVPKKGAHRGAQHKAKQEGSYRQAALTSPVRRKTINNGLEATSVRVRIPEGTLRGLWSVLLPPAFAATTAFSTGLGGLGAVFGKMELTAHPMGKAAGS